MKLSQVGFHTYFYIFCGRFTNSVNWLQNDFDQFWAVETGDEIVVLWNSVAYSQSQSEIEHYTLGNHFDQSQTELKPLNRPRSHFKPITTRVEVTYINLSHAETNAIWKYLPQPYTMKPFDVTFWLFSIIAETIIRPYAMNCFCNNITESVTDQSQPELEQLSV